MKNKILFIAAIAFCAYMIVSPPIWFAYVVKFTGTGLGQLILLSIIYKRAKHFIKDYTNTEMT